jgi:hypothetical protein
MSTCLRDPVQNSVYGGRFLFLATFSTPSAEGIFQPGLWKCFDVTDNITSNPRGACLHVCLSGYFMCAMMFWRQWRLSLLLTSWLGLRRIVTNGEAHERWSCVRKMKSSFRRAPIFDCRWKKLDQLLRIHCTSSSSKFNDNKTLAVRKLSRK